MTEPNEALRQGLHALAEQAGPLSASATEVISRVKRRRRVRAVGVGSISVLAVTGILVGSRFLSPGQHSNGVAGPSLSAHAGPSHRTSAGILPAPPGSPRRFACGAMLAGPLRTRTANGLTLSVDGVSHTSTTSPPRVQITLSTTRSSRYELSNDTGPRILILRDSQIVAGQELPASSKPVPETRPFTLILPAKPTPRSLTLTKSQVCDGTSWAEIWQHHPQYQLVVVTSTISLDVPPPTPGIPPAPNNPLIVAQAPLP